MTMEGTVRPSNTGNTEYCSPTFSTTASKPSPPNVCSVSLQWLSWTTELAHLAWSSFLKRSRPFRTSRVPHPSGN